MNIIESPSPNFFSREGYTQEMIVIHCTDGYFPYDLQYLQNPSPDSPVGPVSAHYVVAPDGEVHQLVQLDQGAWHAGRVNNPTATLKKDAEGKYVNPNYYTIGIETSMIGTEEATDAQKSALSELIQMLGSQFNIPLDRQHVVGHHEIYSLKTCPGTIDIASLLPLNASTASAIIPQVSSIISELPSVPEPSRGQIIESLNKLLSSLLMWIKGGK